LVARVGWGYGGSAVGDLSGMNGWDRFGGLSRLRNVVLSRIASFDNRLTLYNSRNLLFLDGLDPRFRNSKLTFLPHSFHLHQHNIIPMHDLL
jgi:hypothetical protein